MAPYKCEPKLLHTISLNYYFTYTAFVCHSLTQVDVCVYVCVYLIYEANAVEIVTALHFVFIIRCTDVLHVHVYCAIANATKCLINI